MITSRTEHLVGNLETASLDTGEAWAKTTFPVYRSHLETDHQILSGCREDVLRNMNGAWKTAKRRSCSTPTFCSTRASASSCKTDGSPSE